MSTTTACKYVTQQVSVKAIRDSGRVFKEAYATELLSFDPTTNQPETEFRAYKVLENKSCQCSYYEVFVDMYESRVYYVKNNHTSYYATVENGMVVEISQTDAFARLPKTHLVVPEPLPEVSRERIQKLSDIFSRHKPQNAKEQAFSAIYRTIYERQEIPLAHLFILANTTATIRKVTVNDESGTSTTVALYTFTYQDDSVYFVVEEDNERLIAVEKTTLEALNIL